MTVISRLLAALSLFLFSLAAPVHAQDSDPAPAEQAAVDALLTVLNDPAARDALIARLQAEGTEAAADVAEAIPAAEPTVAERLATATTGAIGDLFTEGQGTIAKGYYRGGRFEAVDLLAKHDETYMPREVVDTLKETGVYQDPNS